MYVRLNHFAVHLKLTHCKSTILQKKEKKEKKLVFISRRVLIYRILLVERNRAAYFHCSETVTSKPQLGL